MSRQRRYAQAAARAVSLGVVKLTEGHHDHRLGPGGSGFQGQQANGRKPTPRHRLPDEECADREGDLADHRHPHPTEFLVGLPTARACNLPGSGSSTTHGHHHAVALTRIGLKYPPIPSLIPPHLVELNLKQQS